MSTPRPRYWPRPPPSLLTIANVLFPAQNGYTPLHQAAQQGNTHVVNVLLQHGAKPNATTLVGSCHTGAWPLRRGSWVVSRRRRASVWVS